MRIFPYVASYSPKKSHQVLKYLAGSRSVGKHSNLGGHREYRKGWFVWQKSNFYGVAIKFVGAWLPWPLHGFLRLYLGVPIDNKLTWNNHIQYITHKTVQVNSFLYLNLRQFMSRSRSVNQLWQEFKQAISKVVPDHVPHKVNTSRNRLPWINKQIKRTWNYINVCTVKPKEVIHKMIEKLTPYWKIKNSINTTLKEAHNMYYRRLAIW